jgi:Putative peptidoglycan binding domain
MSTFQTGQWVRRGRDIVILLESPSRRTVERESWAHEDETGSGLHDTAWVQRSLNQVMGAGLAVDGVRGSLTRAAIMDFQRSEGLAVDGVAGPNTQAALERRLGTPSRAPSAPSAPGAGTVGTFDGKPVASWLIPYLSWARANGWKGRLNSGWRDPEYSEKLCWDICGAPTCPGRCAGRNSNHSGSVKPKGAIDVSYPQQFGQLMARCPLTPRIFNDLPDDPVHFSATGH